MVTWSAVLCLPERIFFKETDALFCFDANAKANSVGGQPGEMLAFSSLHTDKIEIYTNRQK